ncbi:MAG: hypothetical protein ACHQ03_11750 [Candidatus Bathyarchaeia archaeon]
MPTRKHYPDRTSSNDNFVGTLDSFIGSSSPSTAAERERIAPRSERHEPFSAEKIPKEAIQVVKSASKEETPSSVIANPEKKRDVFRFTYGDLIVDSEKPTVTIFLGKERDRLIESGSNNSEALKASQSEAKKLHNQAQLSKAELDIISKALDYIAKRLSEISVGSSKNSTKEEIELVQHEIDHLKKYGEVNPYAIESSRLTTDHPITMAAIEIKQVEMKNVKGEYKSQKEFEKALASAERKYEDEKMKLRDRGY